MTETAEKVQVRVLHKTSRPHTYWVEPVNFFADVSVFGLGAEWQDGGVWDDDGELGGMAAVTADLGDDSPDADDVFEVNIADLFWLSAGDCRNVGKVQKVQ
jgi:hypothetical protein